MIGNEEMITIEELQIRWDRCRGLMDEFLPGAGGLFAFSRLNIYYFTGTFGSGLLWLPREGSPVLLSRRGIDRAREESPIKEIYPFKSYRDVKGILSDAGKPVSGSIGVEMNGLSWGMSNLFMKHMNGHEPLGADNVIGLTRAVKTHWELEKLRIAGKMHEKCMVELLPSRIRPGMTEMEISRIISDLYFEHGNHGIMRMEKYGEEVYSGHISSGESANYPSVFNGPVGLRGVHPAVPHMGSDRKAWKIHELLTIDNGFNHEGYMTDKTQVYWSGSAGNIPADVKRAHAFCVETQGWIAEHLRPGSVPSEIWAHSAARAEEAGFSDGFMALGGNKVFFAGHGIGLAVDEYPVLAEGFDRPLEEAMVIAVEPKIGIDGVGMVGVENTFEVTAEGGRSLTGNKYDIICI